MPYTKEDKITILQRNKKIYKIVIKECKEKLPMIKMTYPDSVETYENGYPKYSETITNLQEVIKSIDERLKEMR